ncbi:hypothetical protein thalar_02548 [Litoreibacter arenae DSM 19593]|uniref:Uncharacterized protein n=1 Tax=Litoreibacter arenae DSM 19593 TaxID=1123360 RepID=S9Q614_9RHOB|nr:hypothetical protein thalar_02548 [Litoreibacter arenae DSM 19593]
MNYIASTDGKDGQTIGDRDTRVNYCESSYMSNCQNLFCQS